MGITERTAIVTGITGQDGSLLAEQLLAKGWKVYGLIRRTSSASLGCSAHLEHNPNFEVVKGDLLDAGSLLRLCKQARADHCYSMAAQSHVGASFDEPVLTAQITGLGTLNLLEAIRQSGIHTRFLNAASSEMYGGLTPEPGTEATVFHPRSPYACAKVFSFDITRAYRESYKMFACSTICYNHEQPGKRGPEFVTRKITLGIAAIKAGKQSKLYLGNLKARRDWGLAEEYTQGMQLVLESGTSDDYVLATGETHSVEEFCQVAFHHAGLGNYQQYIEIDPRFYRPAEVDVLIGDYSKIKKALGWSPKTTFEGLAEKMVDYDLSALK